MNKLLRVAFFEYSRHVFRRRFLLVMMSVPAFIFMMVLVVMVMVMIENRSQPWGFIDKAGLFSIDQLNSLIDRNLVEPQTREFNAEEEAHQALMSGEIEVYFVIDDEYLETGKVSAITKSEIPRKSIDDFTRMMRTHLLKDLPSAVSYRLIQGSKLTYQTTQVVTEKQNSAQIKVLVPFISGFFFMLTVFISSGYLMQAVVEEKETRTVEVLLSAVTNHHLMIGKILGIIGVGITQIIIWGLILISGLLFLGFSVMEIIITPDLLKQIAALVALLIPAYIFVSTLMAAIGSMVTDIREGQQYSAIITMPIVIPYLIVTMFMNDPDGTIPVFLSYFPLTSPVSITLRSAFSSIPTPQLISIFLILMLSSGLALWFSGRAFRIGYMNYDRKTSIKAVLLGADSESK